MMGWQRHQLDHAQSNKLTEIWQKGAILQHFIHIDNADFVHKPPIIMAVA